MVLRWSWRITREVIYAIGGGLVAAALTLTAIEYWTRSPWQFGEIEIGYLPDPEAHRVYIGVHYTYSGGCSSISWTNSLTDGQGKIYVLETYEGPVRWPQHGEPALYQRVIDLPKPLPEGAYKWRGLMVCNTGTEGNQSQVTKWTEIHHLYVDHDFHGAAMRTPLSTRPGAVLFTPL